MHAQLFERAGGAPAKKPAIVYVHGGPPRQMLLGWHYSDYYANAYAAQPVPGQPAATWSSRSATGCWGSATATSSTGRPTRAQGAAEYLDVKAAGEYLRTLPQVDPVAHRYLRRLVMADF